MNLLTHRQTSFVENCEEGGILSCQIKGQAGLVNVFSLLSSNINTLHSSSAKLINFSNIHETLINFFTYLSIIKAKKPPKSYGSDENEFTIIYWR